MPRKNTFNTFVAVAAGAATAVTAIEYTRQRRTAIARIGQDSRLIDTPLGVAEVATSGDGPAVLFVHGALGGYDEGLAVGQRLAEAGYQVIAISRPGYLRTPPIDDMSFAGQADFLAAALDALKVKQAFIVGLSAGGPTAVHLAAQHPTRCRALILMCAISLPMAFDPAHETTELWMMSSVMQSDLLTWLSIQAAIKGLPLMALSEPNGWQARITDSPQRRAAYERELWTLFPPSLRLAGTNSDRALVEALDALPHKKVAAPTLVLHGTADTLVPFEHGEYSAAHIKGARLVTVTGGDHLFMVSHDDLVWPEMLDFLKSAAASARRAPARKSAPARKPAARKPAAKKTGQGPAPKPARTTTRTRRPRSTGEG